MLLLLLLFFTTRSIITLAGFIALGLLLNILACALPNNWYPLITVVAYLFVAMPNILCGMCNRGDIWGDGNRGWKNSGYFLTSFFLVGGFAIPLILYHADKITKVYPLVLSIVGGLIVYVTVLIYLHIFHGKTEDEF